MSNMVPLFMTAPRLKIKVDGKTVGFAIGFNINVTADVQPVYVCGQIGPAAIEPTLYNVVTGTMQVVRVIRPSAMLENLKKTNIPDQGLDKTGPAKAHALSKEGDKFVSIQQGDAPSSSDSVLATSGIFAHLDPEKIWHIPTVDIEVYMRYPEGNADYDKIKDKISPGMSASDIDKLLNELKSEEILWMKIVDCRITGRSTNITLGQLVNEPVNFQGLLATPIDESGNQMFEKDTAIKDS